MEPSQTEDLYLRLGMQRTATFEQIKQAYRALALRHHPDRNPENQDLAHENFIAVSEAFEVLFNPTTRAQYDSSSTITSHRTQTQTPNPSTKRPSSGREREDSNFRFYEDFFKKSDEEYFFKNKIDLSDLFEKNDEKYFFKNKMDLSDLFKKSDEK